MGQMRRGIVDRGRAAAFFVTLKNKVYAYNK
jgi:hypothetical protein